MPVMMKKVGGKYRVVEAASGKIATTKNRKAHDGGGHKSREQAIAQVQAINMAIERKKGNPNVPPKKD